MCLISTPSAAPPPTKPPQYLHNQFLDGPAGSGLGANVGRNSLVIPLAGQGGQTNNNPLAPAAPQNNPGLQTPGAGLATPGGSAGLVRPMIYGRPANPSVGGSFAGALPAAPLVKSQ